MEIILLALSVITLIINIVIILNLSKLKQSNNESSTSGIQDIESLTPDIQKITYNILQLNQLIQQQKLDIQKQLQESISKLNIDIIKELHDIKADEYKNINESISKLKDMQLNIMKQNGENIDKIEQSLSQSIKLLKDENKTSLNDIKALTSDALKTNNDNVNILQKNIEINLRQIRQANEQKLNEIKDLNTVAQKENIEKLDSMQLKIVSELKSNQSQLYKENSDNIAKLQQTLQTKLNEIKDSNEQKLNDIQDNVNKKLDTSLNERLDSSFKQVGDQLQSLYKSIGELQTLSVGVTDLQKTLSNVKTRGIFGETQLRNIIENVLDKSQFDENVSTKHNMDFVEFAVKIPDKENYKKFIYLPIDSKFPGDLYNKIVEASSKADKDALANVLKEFENRIKQEAKTINEKYINTPETTDFAIMFLPTEGLYSEAVRLPGLVDTCQQKYKIIICGPSTITALLNSLSIGFRYLTINKNSEEILKVLSSCKTQYDKFRDLILKTQKKLTEAQNLTGDLQHRNELIHKKLYRVDSIEQSEAERILELENIIDVDDF